MSPRMPFSGQQQGKSRRPVPPGVSAENGQPGPAWHRIGPRVAAALAVVTLGGLVISLPLAGSAAAATGTQTFSFTGAPQDFTVPADATSLNVIVTGGSGGGAPGQGQGSPPQPPAESGPR
jgi:hypothetical protein